MKQNNSQTTRFLSNQLLGAIDGSATITVGGIVEAIELADVGDEVYELMSTERKVAYEGDTRIASNGRVSTNTIIDLQATDLEAEAGGAARNTEDQKKPDGQGRTTAIDSRKANNTIRTGAFPRDVGTITEGVVTRKRSGEELLQDSPPFPEVQATSKKRRPESSSSISRQIPDMRSLGEEEDQIYDNSTSSGGARARDVSILTKRSVAKNVTQNAAIQHRGGGDGAEEEEAVGGTEGRDGPKRTLALRVKEWVAWEGIGSRGGWKGLEVRVSESHGGTGGRGVFVKEGYLIEKNACLPYFGSILQHAEVDWEGRCSYVVGPVDGGLYVDGEPTIVANLEHGEKSALWAAALVNQANTADERNCLIVDIESHQNFARKKEYQRETSLPVLCALQATRTIRAGEELLTNYQWDRKHQWLRGCGYDYYAEVVNNQPRPDRLRRDPLLRDKGTWKSHKK